MIQRPRGTRDFGPEEMRKRRHVEEVMRDAFHRFGYQEVATPTFEELELFTAKSGQGIVDELYAFEDKGGRKLTLRPELTAPVIRYYYEEMSRAPKPLKLFYYGSCFRYDRPQKGRYREFWQMGCELIGPDNPEGWAEVVAVGVSLFRAVGLKNLTIRLGHLHVLKGMLDHVGVPEGERGGLMRLVDKREIAGLKAALAERKVPEAKVHWLLQAFDLRSLDQLATHVKDTNEKARSGVEQLRLMMNALSALGVPKEMYRIDPAIARGLDYYTGVVFEMDCPSLGAEKQLLGGGAYDLSGVFGGEATGSIGFGLGFDRTIVALEEEGFAFPTERALDAFVIPIGDEAREKGLALATQLRAEGFMVDVDLMRRGPSKSLDYANAHGTRFALLLGKKEIERGVVTAKDMKKGEQREVPLSDVPEVLRVAEPWTKARAG